MQRPDGANPMSWSNQMPNLNSNRSISPSRMQQNSVDQIDDTDSLLLPDANFDPDEIENLFGDDEMMSQFEDCFRNEGIDGNLAPILEPNIGENSLDGIAPTTSALLQSNNNPSASSHSLLAKKLSRPELQSLRLNAKSSFDESNSKIANFMAKIPFRCNTKCTQKPLELDFNYSPELNVNFHLRKFDYLQLINKGAKLNTRIKALAALLKFEIEEEQDCFLLRNTDAVIQFCVDDHKSTLTNCLISWFGANLRPNDRLKTLIQQNRWLSVLRHLKIMGNLIPISGPMNQLDRINCLNGLIILEHDLTLLFKEDRLTMEIYGKSNVEVFKSRADLTPFTIAIYWETLNSKLSVNEMPQLDLNQTDSMCAYLSVSHNEYMTLFPTNSCLNNKLQWIEMTGIHTPGKYCLNFSQPIIVRNALMKELLELDSAIYTLRPINWFLELSNSELPDQSLSFTRKRDKSECHRYIFANSIVEKSDDYLVRKITFNSPKTIVNLLMKLRRQSAFTGLIKNLLDHFAKQKHLPYNEHLVVKIESDNPTNLVLQFNNNRQKDVGTVNIIVKNSGFEIGICNATGKSVENSKIEEWNVLLNRTWSIPILMHKIIADLKATKTTIQPLTTKNSINSIVENGPLFNKFEYLQEPFIIKRASKKQLNEIEKRRQKLKSFSNKNSKDPKRLFKFLRKCAKNSEFLNEYFSSSNKVYRLSKSSAIKNICIPSARLRAIMSVLSANLPINAMISNKTDTSRIPKFIVSAKTPTILPTMSQKVNMENQKEAMKKAIRRKRLNKQPTTKSIKQSKKPNILKTKQKSRSVRLNTTLQNATTNRQLPDSNAQPAKSILSQKRTHKQMETQSEENRQQIMRMNRLTLARKIVRRRRATQPRFFGILNGWRKLYKHCFRTESETRKKLVFEHKENLNFVPGSLLSAQSENVPDPKTNPLPNPLSPDYFKRMNPQMNSFPMNPMFNPNSFGIQNNYNMNAPYPSMHHHQQQPPNMMYNQPNLPTNLSQKKPIDGLRGMDSFDMGRAPNDNRQLMDLNASELAARRKERNVGNPSMMDAEMDNDNAPFEASSSEEECDPPPPHKINQQYLKDAMRRKRDQELREQRKEKIREMELERQEQAKKEEEKFAQRHQIPMRPTRISNAGLASFPPFNQESIKNEIKYENDEKDQMESFSIKLPVKLNEAARKNSRNADEKRLRKKQRSSSISSSASDSSNSSSDSSQKSDAKKSSKRGSDKKLKKSKLTSKAVENSARSSKDSSKIKELERKISHANESFESTARKARVSGKEELKRSSSASSSSSGSSSSSSASSSSDSRPPTLTNRLQRQDSALTSILQDDESRQSARSNSSIPPLVLATNEPTVRSLKDGRNSRKTSTMSALSAYPFELESTTKNEFDDPESPTFTQLLTPSSSSKRNDENDRQKHKSSDSEKSRSKSSKDKSRSSKKSGEDEVDLDKFKEKKPKDLAKMKSLDKSVDRIAERLKEKEKSAQKLKLNEEKLKKEGGDKLKVKDKSAVPKNRPSPRLQPLPDVFDVPSTTDSKLLKRKRDGKDAVSSTKTKIPSKDADKLSQSSSKDVKDKKDVRDLKAKRPKETKMLQEIPASPLPIQTRKRSPLPRRKDELSKKTRPSDPEFKPSTSTEKSSLRSSKSRKADEPRAVKRTLSTSQSSADEKRKVRKVEKVDEKAKEPETPTKKKLFPDLPEFTARPSLSSLKSFKIPKVVDADTTSKNTEKEKETEHQQEKEKEVVEKSSSSHKESRSDSSRERWERDEKRDNYGHSSDRRDSYADSSYDRRSDSNAYFSNESSQREHYHSSRGSSNYYGGRGSSKFHHGNYTANQNYTGSSHRNYEESQTYNERGGHFRRQRAGMMKSSGSQQYDDKYSNAEYSPQYSSSKSRAPPTHFLPPPHHKKSVDSIESPSYQQPSRSSSNPRRIQSYGREKSSWTTTSNYQDEPMLAGDYPSLAPPTTSNYATFNAPANSFQSPTDDQLDRDFRPPYHRSTGEMDNSGGDSPSDGLRIDENA